METKSNAAAKTTVTHDDGTVSKRTSKSRTYSHAVEIAETRESIAAGFTATAEYLEAETAKYTAAAATGAVTETARPCAGEGDDVYRTLYVGGIFADSYTTGSSRYATELGGTRATEDELRAKVLEHAASSAAAAATHRARAAGALAGPAVRYGVMRWSSRHDLAAKYADECAGRARAGITYTVREVDAS